MSDPSGREAAPADDAGRPTPHDDPERDERATVGGDPSRRAPSPDERSEPPGIGARLSEAGHYRIQSEIARGGMGVVFRGRDVTLGREVAVKVIHAEIAAEPALRERFVEEAQIGGQLQHPGIVPVYELGTLVDERPYFAMKLVKGETLTALLSACADREKELHRFLAIFEAVCQTMAYAHSRGVIHRDLKPSNVMVGSFGEVQLVDWGLAKILSEPSRPFPALREQDSGVSTIATIRSESATTSSGSVAGSVMGTVAYMAPEQARGEIDALDERTDVFALGGILCEILTGKPPYPGKRGPALALAAAAGQVELRARLDACALEPALVALARECLAPDPSARPKDASIVAARLAAHAASVEARARAALVAAAEARGKAAEERRARRLAVGLACSAVLSVVLAAGGWAWWERERSGRRHDTEERVAAALSAASFARGRSEWSDAEAQLSRARAHLDSGVATAGLRARVQEESEALADAVAAERLAHERDQRRRAFVAEVEAIRARVARTNRRKIEGYAEAFARQGLRVGETPDEAIAEAISGSGAGVEMASALEDWGRLLRQDEGRGSDEVRRLFELALAVDGDPLRSRLRRAVLAEDGIEIARIAEEEGAQDLPPMTAIVLADALWLGRDERRAFEVLERTERRHPDDFHLQVKLATRYMNGLELARALPHVKAAEALRPASPWVLTHRGILLYQERNYARAIEYGRRAVAADPGDEYAHNHLGASLEASGDFDAAIECYEAALEIAPDYIFPLRRLAPVLESKGRSAEATVLFRRALELEPGDPDVLNDLAWHLATATDPDQRAPDEACELAERCVALDDHAAHFNTLGIARHRAGDDAGSAEALERAIAQSAGGRGTVEDHLFLALAKERLGAADDARAHYDTALELLRERQPDSSEAARIERFRAEAARALGLE